MKVHLSTHINKIAFDYLMIIINYYLIIVYSDNPGGGVPEKDSDDAR